MNQHRLCYSDPEAGMVTVETALALIAITVFFFILCSMILLCMTKIRAIDISREIARMEARGENFDRGDMHTSVQVHRDKNAVIADVTITVPLVHVEIHASSYAVEENRTND